MTTTQTTTPAHRKARYDLIATIEGVDTKALPAMRYLTPDMLDAARTAVRQLAKPGDTIHTETRFAGYLTDREAVLALTN